MFTLEFENLIFFFFLENFTKEFSFLFTTENIKLGQEQYISEIQI